MAPSIHCGREFLQGGCRCDSESGTGLPGDSCMLLALCKATCLEQGHEKIQRSLQSPVIWRLLLVPQLPWVQTCCDCFSLSNLIFLKFVSDGSSRAHKNWGQVMKAIYTQRVGLLGLLKVISVVEHLFSSLSSNLQGKSCILGRLPRSGIRELNETVFIKPEYKQ